MIFEKLKYPTPPVQGVQSLKIFINRYREGVITKTDATHLMFWRNTKKLKITIFLSLNHPTPPCTGCPKFENVY